MILILSKGKNLWVYDVLKNEMKEIWNNLWENFQQIIQI